MSLLRYTPILIHPSIHPPTQTHTPSPSHPQDAPVVDILATQRDPNTATAIATTTATAANALPTQRSQAPVSRKPPAPFATAIATAHHHPNPSACPPDPRRHPRFMRGPASLRHAASLGLVDYADMTRRLLGTGKSQGGGGAVKRKHSVRGGGVGGAWVMHGWRCGWCMGGGVVRGDVGVGGWGGWCMGGGVSGCRDEELMRWCGAALVLG